MQHNSKLNTVLLIIIVLLLVGVMISLNGNKTKTVSEEQIKQDSPVVTEPKRTPTPTPQPIPTPIPAPKNNKNVFLGQQFTLKENEVVSVNSTDLTITVTGFSYSPCPAGSMCNWSGIGIYTEFKLNGQTKTELYQGPKLSGDIYYKEFSGYKIGLVNTDYKTYADFIVTKI